MVIDIKVEKYTDVEAMRRYCTASTGRESKMTLAKGYALGHSFVRSQRFYITLSGIPQFVANQLVRHKVGVEWVMKSKRTDRGGADFGESLTALADLALDSSASRGDLANRIVKLQYEFDRQAPTNLFGDLNAQAIINISRDRLCAAASDQTRLVWQAVIDEIAKVDPALAAHCVRPCVATGICRERKCAYRISKAYGHERKKYLLLFTDERL